MVPVIRLEKKKWRDFDLSLIEYQQDCQRTRNDMKSIDAERHVEISAKCHGRTYTSSEESYCFLTTSPDLHRTVECQRHYHCQVII